MIVFRKKAKEEQGAVTIEATIALTAFLFAFIMIYSIITLCRAQARIQLALNDTAQEISQYSYIYGMTGLDQSLAKFQNAGNESKDKVNQFVGDTVSVFEGIQALGDDAQSVDISNIDTVMNSWGQISSDLQNTKDDFSSIKQQIENAASNPQQLLFGMARLVGSEALEVAKSKAIAEPITRALIRKHLKRSENDSADAFCKSVGIVPNTYLGTKSYFNGLDFSNSTLFPYGTEEITLITSYKVKLIQLLPIDIELSITQSAATKGWLHGDKTSNSALDLVSQDSENANVLSSVWNSQSINKRNEAIRHLELEKLKALGYKGISGETYIQAYDESTNTFAFVAISNPLYGVNSVSEIDRAAVEADIKRQVAQMMSSTDNRREVTIKETDANGNVVTRTVDCSQTAINTKIVLIVPEDEGLKTYMENVIKELGYSDMYSVEAGYGTGYKLPEKEETGDGN